MFCGAENRLTREHVFPEWLRDVFPDSESLEYVRYASIHGRPDEHHVRPGGPFDVVVRQVCESCNNGWMAQLEAGAKSVLLPMLRDDPTTLRALDQDLIAIWATKTLIALQASNLGGERVLSPEAGRWFFEHQRPLPGCVVRLCRYEPSTADRWPLSVHQGMTSIGVEGEPADEPNAFSVVFAIGPLGFFLAGPDFDSGPLPVPPPTPAEVPIWPVNGDGLRWPPSASARSHQDLGALCRRGPDGNPAPPPPRQRTTPIPAPRGSRPA